MKQNTVFSITEEDVQNIAVEKLGRKLNSDSTHHVHFNH